jgi:hypothetical protein
VGTRAQFTPDNQTVYITMGTVDTNGNVTPNNQLLVRSNFTGWTLTTLTAPASDVTVAVPSVGAYLAGSPTTGRSYCASTTITGTPPNQTSITNQYYPLADSVTVATDRIAATNDGLHILGAVANGASLIDLGFKAGGLPIGKCPDTTVPPDFFTANRASSNTVPLGVTASSITGILPTSDSKFAFVTYNGSGSLPAYSPSTGAVTPVALTGATAPVAGIISSDNTTVFVGTTGDNKVHLVKVAPTPTDDPTKAITPKLQLYNPTTQQDDPSQSATPNLLVQHPRKATS